MHSTCCLPISPIAPITAIPVSRSGKYGLVNSRGELVVPFTHDSIDRGFEGLFCFRNSGKIGFLDGDGNVVLPAQFDESLGILPRFSDGLAVIGHHGKYGYVDRCGNWRIQPKWEMAYDFYCGFAIVESDSGYFVIDKNGNTVSELAVYDIKYQQGWPRSWDYIKCLMFDTNEELRACFLNRFGNVVFPPRFHDLTEMFDGIAGCCLEANRSPNTYGLVTVDGQIVKPPQYCGLWNFDPGTGLAKAGNSFRKYGYINTDGDWAVEPQFAYAHEFSDGLACVQVEKRKGFIDRNAIFAIEPQFDECASFHDGLAVAQLGNKKLVLNQQGDVLWQD